MAINKWRFQLLIHQETRSYRSFPAYAEIPVTQDGNVLQHNLYNRINYLSPLSFSRESKEKKDVRDKCFEMFFIKATNSLTQSAQSYLFSAEYIYIY